MNVFGEGFDAANYAHARPAFHWIVRTCLEGVFSARRMDLALDLACGTGRSAEALVGLCRRVVAIDASSVMLTHARRSEDIDYAQAVAEKLPFASETFDLLSVGLGIHWMDQVAFLAEAERVLRPEGWLVVYDSGFCDVMQGNPLFPEWVERYRERFPAPPRSDRVPRPDRIAQAGFEPVRSEEFVHVEEYDLDRLIGYLRSQSRVAHASLGSVDALETIETWFRETLGPLFQSSLERLEFHGWVLVYRHSI